jgi:hypothetical protein
VFRHAGRPYARAVLAVPRPPARRLLCGHFLVPRVALLALPAGPVLGVDLASGLPVSLELLPAGADLRDRLATAGAREVGTHVGRTVVVSAAVIERPAPARLRQARRAPVAAALQRELGSRRGRVTLAAGALVAAALICSSLLAGTTPHAQAAPSRLSVPAPIRPVHVPQVRVVPAVAHVSPASRGGAARVLVSAPPVRAVVVPVAPPLAPQVTTSRRVARRSPGWVDGLVVGP